VHRILRRVGGLTGMTTGPGGKEFVAELHDRGLDPGDAADAVCQVFGVPRGAARLYVRSHPAWASQSPPQGVTRARASRR